MGICFKKHSILGNLLDSNAPVVKLHYTPGDVGMLNFMPCVFFFFFASTEKKKGTLYLGIKFGEKNSL